ncbi:MAG: CehA/McbA family metallohydrolase, partial [Lachnospiraceae bacterium]|nr:CehA/McbA family metallohydrolase [Lachnospiraceae bacterium]
DEPIDPPDPGEEKEYGLVKTLAEGDLVIIYNRASGKGVSSEMISNYYLAGVDLTDEGYVITTSNEDVIWTAHVNEDGTYTFTQGPVTFGGVQTTNSSGKVYNNINLSEPTATLWTREDTANEGEYYLYLGELPSSKTGGHVYLDWYANYSEFSLNDYANPGSNSAYMFSFYKQDAEPEIEPGDLGDLVTDLSKLTDGTTVSIYSPGHHTAISSKPNGDWYLKANTANIVDGKVTDFTSDFVWTVKVNENGTYSFYSYDDPTKSITVWPSGNYAELSLNVETYPDNTWTLTPAATKNCFYFSSPTVSGTRGPAYIEAYVRNEFEVFSGYFTSPSQSNFKDSDFALQFYLVNPEDAVATHDDGEWDGVLTPGKQYVAHNVAADSSIGLFDPANYSMKAIPTTFDGGKAIPDNGAYVWTVGSMGRYYSFQMNGKYLASNNEEELFLIDPNEDGTVPENAKWFLVAKEGGYIIYNKDASYNGTPVCIEYFSSVFSGWTYSTKNELAIYLFNFYELADGVKVYHDVVQNPTVKFECEDSRYVEQDYALAFTLDDLAPEITDIAISFEAGSQTVPVTEYESSEDGKAYNCVIPASQIDVEEGMESFTIKVVVNNSYEIEYEGLKTVTIIDEPFFENLKPAPNAQTMDDKRPLISAKIGNVGENPTFTMTLTIGEGDDKQTVTVDPVYGVDTLVYTPLEDMADGRVTVHILVERADGVTAEKSWSFTVGKAGYQLYFGQLHSHTTYSDGSGSLETALDYVASLPESANVDFVAFTDHSNYFDTTSAANPADSLNDKSLMTEASLALWNKYKNTVASFNASHTDLLAIAGFEMTWSGGPGHINTFDSDGLVSRNNGPLNNKTNDAGMKLYYETINKGESLNQFNHPGNTFGNFTDFSYWDETTDDHMFLVEVGNGEGQIGAGGYYPSYEQYILALDQGWHLAPTNNQDNHKGRWGNANDARDVVLTNDFSEQGIYDAIRALRVYATEDKNLQVTYVVNDQPMGTIFGEDEKPAELKVEVTVYEPDEKESIQKVEIVADGGKVVQTWDSAAELAEGYVTATLTPDQTYYFARVTEADGDLAVTAPVWVGSGVSAGITEVKSSVDPAIVNEATTLTTTFFSNEETNGTIKSIVYTVDGSKVVGTDTTGYTLTKDGLDVTFSYTPDVAKRVTITVTAVIEFNGKEKTYTKDLILSVRETGGELPVTPIATVMKQTEEGFEYAIEGVVTSNASGYDKDTAFFDCIYVQDETGGICCFPVSGEYKIGDKVHIEGYTDWYQGEPELQVTKIDVIGSGEVEPTVVTSAQINDLSVLGSLVTLKGTIESFEEVNGLIQTIMVKDENGDLARVFIDGYITTGAEVVGCVVGAAIEATGLSSYDDTWPDTNYFARIRIRNRADIICGSAKADVARVYGNTRYKTSIAVAQELKERLGVEKFDTILICTGENPVDALAGSYLSVKMMAPILMVQNKKTPIKLVTDYVKD